MKELVTETEIHKKVKAVRNGKMTVERNDAKLAEGNKYSPHGSVKSQYMKQSATTSQYLWNGLLSCSNHGVDGKINGYAALYYPHPSKAQSEINELAVFWKGVEVINE